MRSYLWVMVLVGSLALVGAVMSLVLTPFLDLSPGHTAAAVLTVSPPNGRDPAGPDGPRYWPPRPEEAPKDLREAVLLGSRLMAQTRKLAPDYVGNDLSCNSCHFQGGLTPGGRNGGISLVGTAAIYPRVRHNQVTTLAMGVNDCFQRSLNGRPLPPESREMTALLTYLQWISQGVPVYAQASWIGLRRIESSHVPGGDNGRQVYQQFCAVCHGADGQGTPIATPLWGPRSYNTGAKMHDPANLAAFVYANMPRENPLLTPEQALDVAAFISAQARPQWGHP